MADYPRDMIGYGSQTPHARWPGAARVAVQFVVNYEEGGENNILHGDAASEAFLSEISGAQPWPGQRHMNMESIYEYGSRAGFWRLYRLFTQRNARVTVFGVASALARNPPAVAAMKDAGWEIATHGLKWIDYRNISASEEREHIAQAVRLHREVTGARPIGMYQGRTSENTLQLTMEEGGFLYSADSYADDLPYWVNGPQGAFLVVPYSLDVNDMRFATTPGYGSGEDFFACLKDAFDVLYAEGEAAPKMMSIGLHCRLVGRPGRSAALARFVDYVQSHGGAWIATREEIARHWARTHPPECGFKPSQMNEALFVAAFGDIFEHTPQIAQRAHAKGLDATHDTAAGLHEALVQAMREMNRDEKMALVNAHPDLAGRLALAKQLTEDSSREQGGVGLDRLSEDELARFTALNEAYKARFDFPFIKAVKGSTKEQILADFVRRLEHDRESEFAEALRQIENIAMFRLQDRLP